MDSIRVAQRPLCCVTPPRASQIHSTNVISILSDLRVISCNRSIKFTLYIGCRMDDRGASLNGNIIKFAHHRDWLVVLHDTWQVSHSMSLIMRQCILNMILKSIVLVLTDNMTFDERQCIHSTPKFEFTTEVHWLSNKSCLGLQQHDDWRTSIIVDKWITFGWHSGLLQYFFEHNVYKLHWWHSKNVTDINLCTMLYISYSGIEDLSFQRTSNENLQGIWNVNGYLIH